MSIEIKVRTTSGATHFVEEAENIGQFEVDVKYSEFITDMYGARIRTSVIESFVDIDEENKRYQVQ